MSGEKRLRTHFGVDCTELFDELVEDNCICFMHDFR